MADWYEDPNNYLKLLPFIGGIGGTLIGNSYSQSAANMSQDAAKAAAARFNPYAVAGEEANWNYRNKLNAGPGNYQDYMNTDYYKFPYEQGIKAMERGAAAKGNQLGGRQLKALTAYGQGYAGSKYDEWMANWYKNLEAYKPQMSAGLVAAGQQASYDALGGMSQAAGQVNQGQNWTDLINALTKYGADVSTLNELKKLLGNTKRYNPGADPNPPVLDDNMPPTGTPSYNPGADPSNPGSYPNMPTSTGTPPTGAPPVNPYYQSGSPSDVIFPGDPTGGQGLGSLAGGIPEGAFIPGLTSTAPSFGVLSGAPYGVEGLAGATTIGAEALGEYGVSLGLGATETGTGIGAGIAAAAPFAAVAAIAAGIYWAYSKGKAEQWKGLNPFANEDGPAVLASCNTIQNSAPEVNPIEFYKSRLPSTETFKARYKAQTGKSAPPATTMHRDEAAQYINWMASQPELIQANQEYLDWFNTNYSEQSASGEGEMWKYVKNPERPVQSRDNQVTYGAEGAIIDEPMMAVGMNTGKRLVMGEAGPEALVPMNGKFNPEAEFYKSKKSNRIFDLNTMSWVRR